MNLRHLASKRLPVWSVAGGLAGLVGTGTVHLFLYLSRGYRDIPKIGPLFLLTVITAGVFIVVLGITRAVLAAALAAGFMVSVVVGYVLSTTVGLFGFNESGESGPAWLAGLSEVGGAVVLLAGVLVTVRTKRPNTIK